MREGFEQDQYPVSTRDGAEGVDAARRHVMLTASDEAASKAVSYALFGLMMNNQKFRSELAAAARETRAALGLPPLSGL